MDLKKKIWLKKEQVWTYHEPSYIITTEDEWHQKSSICLDDKYEFIYLFNKMKKLMEKDVF